MVRRNVEIYNLDVIISVGYRVNTKRGIQFRQWANKIIKDYMLKGYAINQRLLAMEEHMDKRIGRIENTLASHQEKIDFFVRTSLPPHQGIFYDGQIFAAGVTFGADGAYTCSAEPGEFHVWIAPNAAEGTPAKFILQD